MITKAFVFQFVNSYIALFAFAFAEQNFNNLAYNVAIFIIVKQIAMNLVEVFIPIFSHAYKRSKLNALLKGQNYSSEEDRKAHEFAEDQLILAKESNILVYKYLEIVIQFGYIVLFAPAFPLAPVFSIFCNFIEMKSNMN